MVAKLKGQVERTVVFPCVSGRVTKSSVGVDSVEKRRRAETSYSSESRRQAEVGVRMRNTFKFLAPKISNGIQRIIRALKSFSKLFVYKEEEKEMIIGFPTDVKHLTHIGWDGSTTTNPVKGWENLRGPQLVASPSISLKQFELAMMAQAADQQHEQLRQVPVATAAHVHLDGSMPIQQQ